MRYKEIITEAPETADDLFRKIEGLTNMMNDHGAAPQEKETAAKIKTKLETRLAQKFPGAKPSPKSVANPYGGDDIHRMYKDYFDGLKKAMDKEQQYNDARKDPTKDRKFVKDEILKLKQARKSRAEQSAMGNVEAREDVKQIDRRIERLISEFFPEEYNELLARREKSNAAAHQRNVKKSREKTAAKVASKDGVSWKAAMAEHPEAMKEWAGIVKASKIYNYAIKGTSLMWILGSQQFGLKASQIRDLFGKMSPEGQKGLRDAVESVHTRGYINEKEAGYTEAQKANILKAMTPKFDPNNLPKGESTWSEFTSQFGDMFAKVKLKRNKKEAERESIVDALSANVSKWGEEEFNDLIHAALSPEERATAIEALSKVGPKNSIENAKIRRLKNLLVKTPRE